MVVLEIIQTGDVYLNSISAGITLSAFFLLMAIKLFNSKELYYARMNGALSDLKYTLLFRR